MRLAAVAGSFVLAAAPLSPAVGAMSLSTDSGGSTTAEGSEDESRPRSTRARATTGTTIKGGDVVTLARPASVRATAALGSSWVRTSFGSLPSDGAGAVLLSVSAGAAAKAGSVALRPTGSSAAGTSAVDYARNRAVTGLVLVKMGKDGSVQLRSTAGSPKVSARLVGWVPELSGLVVPENAPAARSVTLDASARQLTLTGGAVPAGVSSVLLSMRTSTAKAGRWTWWKPGDAVPATGHAVATGAHRTLVTVAPDAAGRINVKALTGSAAASVRVLGWTTATTTVEALRPARLSIAKPSTLTPVAVAGRLGIPASPQDVGFSVNAAKGATVKVWPNATGAGTPVVSAVSDGGALPVWMQVPTGKKVSVKVTGTSASAALTTSGFVSNLGNQSMSFAPKAATLILGAGDIASTTADGTVSLAPSAEAVAVGNRLLVRPRDGAPYLGRVTAISTVSGVRRLTLESAEIAEAFNDFTASYDGALDDTSDARAARTFARGVSGLSQVSLDYFGGENWGCGDSVDPRDLLSIDIGYNGKANLDFSLADRYVDFFVSGQLQVSVALKGGRTLTCHADAPFPVSVPLGTTGLAVGFGGTGSLSLTTPPDATNPQTTLTGTASLYGGFYVTGSETGGDRSGSLQGSAQLTGTGGDGSPAMSVSLDIGVYVSVGIVKPPGTELPLDPSASLTVGYNFSTAAPNPADDPHQRTMLGPRCADLGWRLYVELGVSVAVALLPDISISVARLDTDPIILWRGPCWGYTGTISWTKSGQDPPAASCAAGTTCPYTVYDERITRTLIGEPAHFSNGAGSWVHQSSSFSVTVLDQKWTDRKSPRCLVREEGSGGGTDTYPDGPAELFQTATVPEGTFVLGTAFGVRHQLRTFNGSAWPECGFNELVGERDTEYYTQSPPSFTTDPRFAPTITRTWTTQNGDVTQTTSVSLVRKEFPRS